MEESLIDCPHSGIGVHDSYCDHGDDAGVTCLGMLIECLSLLLFVYKLTDKVMALFECHVIM